MQWHHLDRVQTICTSLQADNHTNTSSLNFSGLMLFLTPKQQCQNTRGNRNNILIAVRMCYSLKQKFRQWRNIHLESHTKKLYKSELGNSKN